MPTHTINDDGTQVARGAEPLAWLQLGCHVCMTIRLTLHSKVCFHIIQSTEGTEKIFELNSISRAHFSVIQLFTNTYRQAIHIP